MTCDLAIPSSTNCRRPLAWLLGAALLLATLLIITLNAGGQITLLALSTLASEDLTCITTGQLIDRGHVDLTVGIVGCFVGIFLGDLGLWMLGRLIVRRVITWPWLTKVVDQVQVERTKTWLDGRLGRAIFASRFLPGARLPVYVAMGAAGVDLLQFSLWSLFAVLVWTPLIVLLVAHAGDAIVQPLRTYLGFGTISFVVAIGVGVTAIRVATMLLTEIGRAKLVAKISKIWRWEFWPSWLFYLPALPWIAWLSIRHRGFTTITAANPGIPHGGFAGESKFAILRGLDPRFTSRTALIHAGDLELRIARFDKIAQSRYPLILKPDAGQRGAGIKLIHNRDEAIAYLQNAPQDVIVQPYHPGPFEAGIFYYRIPGESRGRILSITDKRFSEIIGDGVSTLVQLLWRHPRYRMQANLFLTRHAAHAQRVLAKGEHFRLALAGNHCQGTMFCDGAHLLTAALEKRIDEISQGFDGFYFGRFDVRYTSVEAFKAGTDLTIIELNGVTSESTNLYDPSWSLLRAYRLLLKQWSILFRIAAANRSNGHRASTLAEVIRDTLAFYRGRQAGRLADG